MNERWRNRRVAGLMAVSALAALLNCTLLAVAQAQLGSKREPDRAALLKVEPDLAGFRNGVFLEPDPIDFADHTGYISLFDGKTLVVGTVSRGFGRWRTVRLWVKPPRRCFLLTPFPTPF